MTTLQTSIGIWILIATLANGFRRFERDNSNQQQLTVKQQQVTTKQQQQPESEVIFGLNNLSDSVVEIPVNAKEGEFKVEQLKVAEKVNEIRWVKINSFTSGNNKLVHLRLSRNELAYLYRCKSDSKSTIDHHLPRVDSCLHSKFQVGI